VFHLKGKGKKKLFYLTQRRVHASSLDSKAGELSLSTFKIVQFTSPSWLEMVCKCGFAILNLSKSCKYLSNHKSIPKLLRILRKNPKDGLARKKSVKHLKLVEMSI
jgi:hypothetical protein